MFFAPLIVGQSALVDDSGFQHVFLVEGRPKELGGKAADEHVRGTQLLNSDFCIEANVLKPQYGGNNHLQGTLLLVTKSKVDLSYGYDGRLSSSTSCTPRKLLCC